MWILGFKGLSFLTLYIPSPDENEISLYMITACLNMQVTRIKEVITDDRMSWYLDKFSLLVSYEMYGDQ